MKQLDIFESNLPLTSPKKEKRVVWKLFVDGASRKNPGKSGAGVYVLKDGMVVFRKGYYLGHKTNNQAEYLALLLGVFYCKKHMLPGDTLCMISDSELLIKQMQGIYKVKNAELKKYFDIVVTLLKDMHYSFAHVMREKNQEADALANDGIDKQTPPPHEFLAILSKYDIPL